MCQALLCDVDHATGRYGEPRIGTNLRARGFLSAPDWPTPIASIACLALLTSRQPLRLGAAYCRCRFPVSHSYLIIGQIARHLVGEGDDDEHARLARQHASRPELGELRRPFRSARRQSPFCVRAATRSRRLAEKRYQHHHRRGAQGGHGRRAGGDRPRQFALI